ncbi:uncharacterized protein (DUF2164 family) [Alkalibacillus flavidus]|uniref:Uncharacterized protein (DUF2164 family) n=1 Tax=Alkalibacillus flavidus TaxID=546021 RepID=A0ABV2KQW4_9BACI
MNVPDFVKDNIKSDIKRYFADERGEDLGDLAVDNLYTWLTEQLAPHFYNQGVHDARQIIDEKTINLDEDLRSLERTVRS